MSAEDNAHASFIARSWARLSGRSRRQRLRRRRTERSTLPMDESFSEPAPHEPAPAPDSYWAAPEEPRMLAHHPSIGFDEEAATAAQPSAAAQPSTSRQQQFPAGLVDDIASAELTKRRLLHRGMDRIRRSFRKSFRRQKSDGSGPHQALTPPSRSNDLPVASDTHPADQPVTAAPTKAGGLQLFGRKSAGKKHAEKGKSYAQLDELAVRSAACSFPVKYLGACEVFESRGMTVCEGALQLLRTRKRQTKALLYVSGDGLRVVDQESNRGLVVDQTIEKVSFCAPDRHNHKGFAYICRDGATRRWMCHGFHAHKETGERLSHAVGCAFTVCLEKKRKRDAETLAFRSARSLASAEQGGAVSLEAAQYRGDWNYTAPASSSGILSAAATRTNPAYSSFRRQLSIAERKLDPQTAIINNAPVAADAQRPVESNDETTTSMSSGRPRPLASRELFERQGSIATAAAAASTANPLFRRYSSMRADIGGGGANGMAATRSMFGMRTLHNEPIYEGEESSAAEARLPVSQSFAPLPAASDGGKEKAEEWLNMAFRSSIHIGSSPSGRAAPPHWSSFDGGESPAPLRMPYSQSESHFPAALNGAPPNQPPPPLPPAFNGHVAAAAPPVCGWPDQADGSSAAAGPSTPFQRACSRNSSASSVATGALEPSAQPSRLDIEYELLEEEEPELSSLGHEEESGVSPAAAAAAAVSSPRDPFDVKWSADVLETCAFQRTMSYRQRERPPSTNGGGESNGGQGSEPVNPFIAKESAPVNV